jgi:PAS domain S-box-containing protein
VAPRDRLPSIVETKGYRMTISDDSLTIPAALAEAVVARDEANERLRAFQDGIPNLAWTATVDGQVDYVNRRWIDFTGLPSEELLGEKWLQVLDPADQDRHGTQWRHAMGTGAHYEQELRIRRHDGVYRWHSARDWPHRDEQGRIERWYGTMTDVDDGRRLTDELRASQEDLRALNRELDLFASIAAHDLKEPLRMVTSYLALLQRRAHGKLDEHEMSYLAESVSGAQRMRTMIEDLLRFARVNHEPLRTEGFGAMSALAEALENLGKRIDESKAEVTHGQLPDISADRAQIVRLFQNLVGNAVKFVPAGERPRVHITAVRDAASARVVFSVRDNGIGMERDALERIFAAFARAHDREQFPGTGLGLAICKRIVDRHGGSIWVESTPGAGSIFFFSLPAA